MAFLDNSGDIILDAVLTDTGRFRLAKGDGSFRVAKFAVGDDEINYELYNKSHSSGSAYYDLEILQTPCLEAFTNNSSMLKNRLMSLNRTNLLYMPVLKLNTLKSPTTVGTGTYVVTVDTDTFSAIETEGTSSAGFLNGANLVEGATIHVDQGLDTTEISAAQAIDPDLNETQYMVQIDNRFGNIASTAGNAASVSFIDDDQVATYYLSSGTDAAFVIESTGKGLANAAEMVIAGPRGTQLTFKIGASIELNSSTYLFEQMGSTSVINGTSVRHIDSIVRVTGATTGASIDIPVRFIKKI